MSVIKNTNKLCVDQAAVVSHWVKLSRTPMASNVTVPVGIHYITSIITNVFTNYR